jgi:DNA-binding NarL/FixJ family response regulator
MKILVVDDHRLVREMICGILIREDDVENVVQAGTGREALEKIGELRPEVVLLDVSLPDIGGLEVIPLLTQASPSTHIVLLSEHALSHMVERGLRAGAVGYVIKSDAGKELITALRAVIAGSVYICTRLNASASLARNSSSA